VTQSFSQYQISELWKNFLFIGSGSGWDPTTVVQPPLSDGVGTSTGLQILSDRIVSSNPTELLGAIKLGPTTVRFSPVTTSVQEGQKTAIVSANQISVVDGQRSLRLKPNSIVIDEVEFSINAALFTKEFALQAAIAIAPMSLVRVNNSGQAVTAQFDEAEGYSVLGGSGTVLINSFGAPADVTGAQRGQVWWALGSLITSQWVSGSLIIGISPAQNQIFIWPKYKLV
jgi:hypothetical protein